MAELSITFEKVLGLKKNTIIEPSIESRLSDVSHVRQVRLLQVVTLQCLELGS